MLERVKKIVDRITMMVLGNGTFKLRVEHDNENPSGRIFLQVTYQAPCTKTGELKTWNGRKWYLSKYMTDDEVIKTAYVAFESALKHETMEGFKVDGIILFNPHVNFEALLEVSNQEVRRENVE